MAQLDWYNDNANRSFPFLAGSVDQPVESPRTLRSLADNVIVDAGFIMAARAGFDPTQHRVFLSRLERSGSTFRFFFASDAPALYGAELVFTRTPADDDYPLEFVDGPDSAEQGSGSSSGSLQPERSEVQAECPEPLWRGYLVTGSWDDLDAFLDTSGVVEHGGGAILEPALIECLSDGYLTSVNLANDDRTRARPQDGCPHPEWGYPEGLTFVRERCLTGLLCLEDGYNLRVTEDVQAGRIRLDPGPGAGAGFPCTEIPVFPGETAPEDFTTLDGALRCSEVLRSFNGLGGPSIEFAAGAGVRVTPDPANFTVTVAVDLHDLLGCGSSDVSENV